MLKFHNLQYNTFSLIVLKTFTLILLVFGLFIDFKMLIFWRLEKFSIQAIYVQLYVFIKWKYKILFAQ